MTNAFFIDTTLCTGCRGCQVACKQWHDLPAEETKNRGSYQNPADLSFSTYKLVRMSEKIIDGRLHWLFFADQCRHCLEAPCLQTAENEDAIYRDNATGAILFTANTWQLLPADIIESCPYNIPRQSSEGLLAKCDMCNDRIHNGELPACVKTCPTGAMNFGKRTEILTLATKRLAEVRTQYPLANLTDPEDVSVIYLVSQAPDLYSANVMGKRRGKSGITRQMALKRLMRPLSKAARRIAT